MPVHPLADIDFPTRRRPRHEPAPARRGQRRAPGMGRPMRVQGRPRGHTIVFGTQARSQRCTVKISFAKNRRSASWSAHGRYLARHNAQRPQERGWGFNQERADLALAQTLHQWQHAGDPHLFKVIVAPEHRLPLQPFTRELLSRMERDLGTRLQWVAIDHYNTRHPHVHIVLRGIDDHGKPLRLQKGYLLSGIRTRSEELATRTLGLRTDYDLLRARAHATRARQWTEIDRDLLHRADKDGQVMVPVRPPTDHIEQARAYQDLARLYFLSTLPGVRSPLAQHVGSHTWQLSSALEQTLRELQQASDKQKTRARLERDRRAERQHPGGPSHRQHTVARTFPSSPHERTRSTPAQKKPSLQQAGTLLPFILETLTMNPSERTLPTFRQVALLRNARITMAKPIPGSVYTGTLVAYATNRGRTYAVLETGRGLTAVRLPHDPSRVGTYLRVTAPDQTQDRRRSQLWRIVDDERVQARGQHR